ncbi:MAG TPA: FecR domain-containing protein [Vicinamibacterales bacterium]|jgi:transmembrane sensor|nr:FecR domain-containing protein [Vicinamibacterales bacterium]
MTPDDEHLDPTQIDWVALDKYISGEASPDEQAAMRRRIATNPALAEVLATIRSLHASDDKPSPSDVASAWHAFRLRAGISDSGQGAMKAPPHARSQRSVRTLTLLSAPTKRSIWPRAAALLVVSIGALGTWRVVATRSLHHDSGPTFRATFSTGRGERATVDLQDGSRVSLAPETELRVASVGRRAYLTGEAVFFVKHDPTSPFRVFAPNGVAVQDIGTRFDMRAYPEEHTVRVAVAEGSVALQGDTLPNSMTLARVTLDRGSIAVVDSTGATTVKHQASIDEYLSWASGRLTFTDVRVADVLDEFSRWFDFDVRLGDEALADQRLTVTLDNVPPDVALDMIARAIGARVVREGRGPVAVLYSRARGSTHE